MKTIKTLVFAAAFMILSSCAQKYPDLSDGLYAKFNTNKGDFTAELYYQKATITVANFVSLAQGTNPKVKKKFKGKNFYDGLTFHRIIDGFMIQGGDPEGTGKGGPGYKFPDEINDSLQHDKKGVLSMANSGPDTNGSQFFITLAPKRGLDGHYSVFGHIIKGQDVVDSIGKVETARRNKPVDSVVMKNLEIIRKGKQAKNFNAPKVFKNALDDYQKAEAERRAKEEAERKERADTIAHQMESNRGDFKKTDSGLKYKVTKENPEGEKPAPGQNVSVHYTGYLKNGKVFDSSRERGRPITFPIGVGKVIPGWDEGIQLLKTGEKARFIIPSSLGYGQRSAGPIPPNSTLIFDVELMDVNQ